MLHFESHLNKLDSNFIYFLSQRKVCNYSCHVHPLRTRDHSANARRSWRGKRNVSFSFPLHNAVIDLMPVDINAESLGKRQIKPQNRH